MTKLAEGGADSFGARTTMDLAGEPTTLYRLAALEDAGLATPDRLPYSIRILLENLLRHEDGETVTAENSGLSKREWRELMALLGREQAVDD